MLKHRGTRMVVGAGTALGAAILALTATAATLVAPPVTPAPAIVQTSSLLADGAGAVGLAALQNRLVRGSADKAVPLTPPAGGPARADRGVNLGGIGSDLFQSKSGSSNVFWMTTDRGPNGEDTGAGTGGTGFRSFPTPWFTPTLLQVRASGSELKLLDAIAIRGGKSCKTPVGGLPNLGGTVLSPANSQPYDDPPLTYNLAQDLTAIPYTQSGLDVEGLVRARDDFWFVEEYSPSLGRISDNGCLKERIVPAGLPLDPDQALAPVRPVIPAIYQLRKKNRGFEALAVSPNGRYLFIGLQSPLLNPTSAAGNASQNTRILRYNLSTKTFDAEYVYRFQDPTEYPRDDGSDQTARTQDMKLSSLVALDNDTLLVNERTDLVAKLFVAELGSATNVLGTWDCTGDVTQKPFLGGVTVPICATTATNPSHKSLEQMNATELAANGINAIVSPTSKSLVVVLDSRVLPAGTIPQKIEGVAVVKKNEIAVANDNDFNIQVGGNGTAFDTTTGNMILRNPAAPSQLIRIKLDQPLPST